MDPVQSVTSKPKRAPRKKKASEVIAEDGLPKPKRARVSRKSKAAVERSKEEIEQLRRITFLTELIDRARVGAVDCFSLFQRLTRTLLHTVESQTIATVPISFWRQTSYSASEIHEASLRAVKHFKTCVAVRRRAANLPIPGDCVDICVVSRCYLSLRDIPATLTHIQSAMNSDRQAAILLSGTVVSSDGMIDYPFKYSSSINKLDKWLISSKVGPSHPTPWILWWRKHHGPSHVFMPVPPYRSNLVGNENFVFALINRDVEMLASLILDTEDGAGKIFKNARNAMRSGSGNGGGNSNDSSENENENGDGENENGSGNTPSASSSVSVLAATMELATKILFPCRCDVKCYLRDLRTEGTRIEFVKLMMGHGSFSQPWPYILPACHWALVMQDMILHSDFVSIQYIAERINFNASEAQEFIEIAFLGKDPMSSFHYGTRPNSTRVTHLGCVIPFLFTKYHSVLEASGILHDRLWVFNMINKIYSRQSHFRGGRQEYINILAQHVGSHVHDINNQIKL